MCRDEATRTPDPYVPNVVRYQLRYIPNGMLIPHLIHKALQSYIFFLRNVFLVLYFFDIIGIKRAMSRHSI